MRLLYLSLTYMVGVALGWWLGDAGLFRCQIPNAYWMVPLAILPFTPLINRLPIFAPLPQKLRWPRRFGFRPLRFGPSPALVAALTLCLIIGVLRYASHPFTPCLVASDLAYYNLPVESSFDKQAPKVLLNGWISSYPLLADRKQKTTIHVTKVIVDGTEHVVDGEAQVSVRSRQRLRYGEAVVVRGRLVTPTEFDSFSYRDYLARRGVHSVLYDAQIDVIEGLPNQGSPIKAALYAFRSRGEALLNKLLPEPYAALANGMLLGIEAGIPDDLYDKFNATGSSHVIVISGSNVALIAMVFLAIGKRIFGQRHAIWATLLAIAAYSLLVGGDPAVLRAALMGSLVVIAGTLGRRSTALVSLAFACWIMTLVNPLTVWDVGFQLSSAATAGLILFTDSVQGFFDRGLQRFKQLLGRKQTSGSTLAETTPSETHPVGIGERIRAFFSGAFSEALVGTLAANISTLPLVVYYFGRISAVSIATNLLIVPVQPPILFAGSAGVLVGVAGLEWIAKGLLEIAHAVLWWTVMIVSWTASLPYASIEILTYSARQMAFTMLLIGLLRWRGTLWGTWRRWVDREFAGWRLRFSGSLATGMLSLTFAASFLVAQALPDRKLHIYFLDIGQGDGILIETPSGRQMLIDGGRDPQQLFTQLADILPWWDRTLDVALLTHPDGDHMWAQEALPQHYQIRQTLLTPIGQASVDAERWLKTMRSTGALAGTSAGPVPGLQEAGGKIDLGDGVLLDVLWPPPGGFDPAAEETDDHVDTSYDNENSLVMRLHYGAFSLLLTADIGKPTEDALLASGIELSATVLKVGHHGSKFSSSQAFIEAVNPQWAVIQVGEGNEYGHPHPSALNRLAGRSILRTDINGRVEMSSDGKQVWVELERNQPMLRLNQE